MEFKKFIFYAILYYNLFFYNILRLLSGLGSIDCFKVLKGSGLLGKPAAGHAANGCAALRSSFVALGLGLVRGIGVLELVIIVKVI